jgi:ABC-type multidrug transport system ATPase subunit
VLRAERLGRRFGDHWIFRNIEFDVGPGDVLRIAGANGAGKSTLLKILVGLLLPTEGRVSREDLTIGYAALDLSVYPNLSVREHFEFLTPQVDPEPWLERVGLMPSVEQPSGRLSTGQRARLKLALAAASEPDLLVVDEPSASMDDAGRQAACTIIGEHRSRGGVIYASNDDADRSWATHELVLA